MKLNLTTILGSISAVIGAWFFLTESSYAQQYNNDLASTLQWVGIAQTLSGIAIAIISLKDN